MASLAEWVRHPWVSVAAAAVLMYVAARAGADAIGSGGGGIQGSRGAGEGSLQTGLEPRPMRLALANWMPIAFVTLLAAAWGQAATALAVVLASSVACLSLVPGATLVQQGGPRRGADPALPSTRLFARSSRRSLAGLLLPAVTVLLFFAGIRGQLTWFHAVALLLVGGAVVVASPGRGGAGSTQPPVGRAVRRSTYPVLQGLLAVVIAGGGGVVALHAAGEAARASNWASLPLVTAVLLSPLLVLSLLGVSADWAARGHSDAALEAQRRVVLLNLCLLLPLVIVEAHTGWLGELLPVRPASVVVATATPTTAPTAALAAAGAATGPATAPTPSPTTLPATPLADDDAATPLPKVPLPFPLALWRVDAVVLVILSLFFWPAAQGRWALSRGEGAGLIVGYLAYLLLTLLTQLDLPPLGQILRLLLHPASHGG